jgi:CheY-like chemotaxis protein
MAHRCTILVVDDDSDVQEMIRVAFTADGFTVASAVTARDAIDYLRSHAETCAILLDLMLPDLDGAEFRRIQQQDRSLAWIPVVVTSAGVDGERIAREIGVDFVGKPLDLDQLRQAIQQATRKNRLHGVSSEELAGTEGGSLSSA